MRKPVFVVCLLVCASLSQGRQSQRSCGSYPERSLEEYHLHGESANAQNKQARRLNSRAAFAASEIGALRSDIGNIAVLDDSGGVVARRNPFNLNETGKQTVRFVPAAPDARKYRFEVEGLTYDSAAASAGTVLTGLADDASREVPLPFTFTFFGKPYRSIFINSDGNATFEIGDAAITDRSLGRFTSGAPRIAPLFRDLDPSRSPTGVTTLADGSRFVVSWVKVPEFQEFGTGPLQTFQLRLYADGRIEFSFSEVNTSDAVTGITPGRLQGETAIVSFANDSSGEYSSTIAERFSGDEQVDIFAAAQKFYQNHEDSYDYLVIYNAMGIEADDDAVAFEVTVRNNRSGYGDQRVDAGFETGSKRRLQAILNMGPLSQYPADPNAKVAARLSVGDTPLTTLAHETGHLFLAFASVRDANDPAARPMLGHQTAHWNFLFNSEASLLEGNRIQDNGPGASPRFQTVATVEGFSPLDQYLMGFRPPEEVPDTFLVTNATGRRTSGLPQTGITLDGTRRDIRVDEIIAAEGRRTPDHTVAQRKFRFAFIVVTPDGQDPTPEQLQQLETYRAEFERFYARVTSNSASADTALRKALRVSTWPAAGVLQAGRARASITIERPAERPLTIMLRSVQNRLSVPSAVTIPAGSSEATFEFTGRTSGTDELVAEAMDAQFESVISRIQIAAPEQLRLMMVDGDRQVARPGVALPDPIRVRVTDINELPYPGAQVSVSVEGGGSVNDSAPAADLDGVIALRWTPGSGPVNELRVALPSGGAIVATALGRPLFAQTSVVNAASYRPGLAAGAIGTIFGASLADARNAQVFINGREVPVFYATPRQLNFFVPLQTPEGAATLVVRTAAGSSEPIRVDVAPTQPGLFFDTASGYGAVLVAGTGRVTQVQPAGRGETVEIYATGLGAVRDSARGLQETTAVPQVQIGGLPAEVTFSGLAPGFTGLYQINAVVPNGVAAGGQTLSLSLNGARANDVRIAIR
jgi:uncharacterized protein (TIGR03437 family)